MNTETKTAEQNAADFESRLAASTFRGALQPYDAEREAETLRTTDTGEMVKQVTRKIENLQTRLSESRGFNPKTGAQEYVIGKDELRRQAMENELHHLRTAVLPYTQAQAAEIDARKTQLPTVEQQLQAEADRQQRLAAAAQKRAEEIEVEEMARRILAGRRGSV